MGRSLAELQARARELEHLIDAKLSDLDSKRDGIELAEKRLGKIREERERAVKDGDHELVAELDRQAKRLFDKIAARRDDRADLAKRASILKRLLAKVQTRIEKRRRRDLDAIECLDGCAMPRGHKLLVLDARANGGWRGVVNSGDRTVANCDRCSNKMSQAELWAAYQNGTGNPANPPASYCSTCGGTHEYVNDGTAYPTEPKGKRGPWWWLGLDVSDGAGLAAALTRLGYGCRRPYSHESWHVNLTRNPQEQLMKRKRI